MSEDLAYRITKALFDHQNELAAIHPEAEKLSVESAVTGSTVPFHPGAVRYYEEQGAWPGRIVGPHAGPAAYSPPRHEPGHQPGDPPWPIQPPRRPPCVTTPTPRFRPGS